MGAVSSVQKFHNILGFSFSPFPFLVLLLSINICIKCRINYVELNENKFINICHPLKSYGPCGRKVADSKSNMQKVLYAKNSRHHMRHASKQLWCNFFREKKRKKSRTRKCFFIVFIVFKILSGVKNWIETFSSCRWENCTFRSVKS
jgi:hypothetical protein